MLLALLMAGCAILPVKTVTFKGDRETRFRSAVRYYERELRTYEIQRLVFQDGGSYKDACAWVVRDVYTRHTTLVGLDHKNPRCKAYKPEWLALHEVCHVRMAHTSAPFDLGLTQDQKEAEVSECMKAYARERK